VPDKGLPSRIDKEFLQLNHKKDKQYNSNWAKNLNSCFSKEDTEMTKAHGKVISRYTDTSQKAPRYHFTPVPSV
jgi:uncharacterized protein